MGGVRRCGVGTKGPFDGIRKPFEHERTAGTDEDKRCASKLRFRRRKRREEDEEVESQRGRCND